MSTQEKWRKKERKINQVFIHYFAYIGLTSYKNLEMRKWMAERENEWDFFTQKKKFINLT